MLYKRIIEFLVGLFILSGVIAIFMLAFKVSGLNAYSNRGVIRIRAVFDNIGDLKVRAPITIAGVRIGEVKKIAINCNTFKAEIDMLVDKKQNKLPVDTAAKILTAGIIGANYIELIPGFSETFLNEGDLITDTQSAIILENLIGQLIYKLGSDKK
jgi:phospholipid/cholesterol/gamma-HCH transport system substrate-binding protein